jgi:hypothetical protein
VVADTEARIAWLTKLVTNSVADIALHEDRKRGNTYTALPVPSVDTLVPGARKHATPTSIIHLDVPPGADLTPQVSLGDLLASDIGAGTAAGDDDGAAASASAKGRDVHTFLSKLLKRYKTPPLSASLQWSATSDEIRTPRWTRKRRLPTYRAGPLATGVAVGLGDGDAHVATEVASGAASSGADAAVDDGVNDGDDAGSLGANHHAAAVAETTRSAGPLPLEATRADPEVGRGVDICFGRKSTKYVVVTRRGRHGGKYRPHLFVMDRTANDGMFAFANGEQYVTLEDAVRRYESSPPILSGGGSGEDSCTDLGCVLHRFGDV